MFNFDPGVRAALGLADGQALPPPAKRSWEAIRRDGDASLAVHAQGLDPRVDVVRREVTLSAEGMTPIPGRWYEPADRGAHSSSSRGPAVIHLHGGGWILGSLELYDRVVAGYVADSGVPFLAVDYRLAPEHPHPAALLDCLTAVGWLHEHCGELGVDPQRVAVMGDSAGGGLAAQVAVVARDRRLPLAAQVLIYPGLDDRTRVDDPALVGWATWSGADSASVWACVLPQGAGAACVAYPSLPISAARVEDLTGVAAAYLEVGELDLFRDECLVHARRLLAAGTPVELHVHRGAPHGFDGIAPSSPLASRARADRIRVLRGL